MRWVKEREAAKVKEKEKEKVSSMVTVSRVDNLGIQPGSVPTKVKERERVRARCSMVIAITAGNLGTQLSFAPRKVKVKARVSMGWRKSGSTSIMITCMHHHG